MDANQIKDCPLAIGTVGWADDNAAHDLGDSVNDGASLVKVTLFRGRDLGKPLDNSVAQGQKILSRLNQTLTQIPTTGTQVLVALPEPLGMAPGGSVILCSFGNQYKPLKNAGPGSWVIPIQNSQGALYGRTEDGSLTFATTDDNTEGGNSIFWKIGGTGGGTQYAERLVSPWITLEAGPNGYHVKHATGAQLRMGAISGLPPPLNQLGSYATLRGAIVKLDGTTVLLGPDAPGQLYFPIVYWVDAISPAPTPPMLEFCTALTTYLGTIGALMGALTTATGAGLPLIPTLAAELAALESAMTTLNSQLLTTMVAKVSP